MVYLRQTKAKKHKYRHGKQAAGNSVCETEFHQPQVKICEMANSSLTAVFLFGLSVEAYQLRRKIDLVRFDRPELKLF